MSKRKIVPTMSYDDTLGNLQLSVGKRSWVLFESIDDYGEPFTKKQPDLADAVGPLIVAAFNALPEEQRMKARVPIDTSGRA